LIPEVSDIEPVARYLVELVVGLVVAVTAVEVLALAFLGLRRLLRRALRPRPSELRNPPTLGLR
jgi:hypothetical protein